MVEKLPYEVIERPKMPRATWDALRSHVVRERLRKKEENQEFERQKLARENKKKQEASTLEETNKQIQSLEDKLVDLKNEKHELFNTLKRVLYQDEKERRSKPVSHPSMYLQPSIRANHAGILYGKHNPQTMLPQGHAIHNQPGQKRQRSPSPAGNRGVTVNYAPKVTKEEGIIWPPPSSSAGNAAAVASHYVAAGYQVQLDGAGGQNFPRISRGVPVDAREEGKLRLNAPVSVSSIAGRPGVAYATSSDRDRPAIKNSRGIHPPQAHGGASGPLFRQGSIMTGYPRYQPPTANVSSAALSRQSASPRISHAGQQNGTRFY